jgi:phage recombination protein Bet
MSTALAAVKKGRTTLARRVEGWAFSPEETQLIKSTCAPKDVTDSEFKVFLYVAAQRHLNPLLKQIYAVRRKGVITHQTGIDGFRATAARTGVHAGTDDAVFEGQAGDRHFSASVTVWKLVNGVRCPFTATARWAEYLPEPPNDFMWKRMPHSQLGKCAEALALRKAFPEDLGGLYTNDEMAQAGPVIEAEASVVEEPKKKARPAKAAAAPDTPAEEPPTGDKISHEQRTLLWTVARQDHHLPESTIRAFVKVVSGVESTTDIPRATFDRLLRAIENKAAQEAAAAFHNEPDDERLEWFRKAIEAAQVPA